MGNFFGEKWWEDMKSTLYVIYKPLTGIKILYEW